MMMNEIPKYACYLQVERLKNRPGGFHIGSGSGSAYAHVGSLSAYGKDKQELMDDVNGALEEFLLDINEHQAMERMEK